MAGIKFLNSLNIIVANILEQIGAVKIRLGDTPETELQTETQVEDKINEKLKINVTNQTSEGQEVVALEPIDNVNTDAFLVSKPVHEGSASAANKLLKQSEFDAQTANPNLNQFEIETGIAYWKSRYQLRTGSSLSFKRPAIHARSWVQVSGRNTDKVLAPEYYFLSLPERQEIIDTSVDGTDVIVFHSAVLLPDILTPNRPTSPLPTYANQAAMLADQANQVTDSFYYYTGSTSAWRKTATSTGVIGNYVEQVAVSGWQEWGTKPDWLIITGDSYSLGVDNMNRLTFTFKRFHNDGTPDVVVCNIQALVGLNPDSEANRLGSAIAFDIDFNSNQDLVADNDLSNNAPILATLFRPEVLRPSDAVWVDLGSGRYVLRMGVSNTHFLQSYIKFVMPNGLKFYSLNRFTFVIKLRSPVGTANIGLSFLQNHNTVDTNGFSCNLTNGNNIRLRMNGVNSSGITLSTAFQQQGTFWTFCWDFNGTNLTIVSKSAEISRLYTIEINNASFSQAFANLKEFVIGNNAAENGANRGNEFKHARLLWTSLTPAQRESLVNEIDAK